MEQLINCSAGQKWTLTAMPCLYLLWQVQTCSFDNLITLVVLRADCPGKHHQAGHHLSTKPCDMSVHDCTVNVHT